MMSLLFLLFLVVMILTLLGREKLSFITYGAAIVAAYSTQYHKQQFIPFKEQSGLAKLAIVTSLFFVTMNVIVTFAECGPLRCPDDPTTYWLSNQFGG